MFIQETRNRNCSELEIKREWPAAHVCSSQNVKAVRTVFLRGRQINEESSLGIYRQSLWQIFKSYISFASKTLLLSDRTASTDYWGIQKNKNAYVLSNNSKHVKLNKLVVLKRSYWTCAITQTPQFNKHVFTVLYCL